MHHHTSIERACPMRAAFALIVALSVPAALLAQATPAAERATAWAAHQSLTESSWYRGLAWRPVGPVKIGARVEAIAIPPGNTGTIYAGVGSGNLWKTVNNGLTWKPIFEHQSAFAIGDVAVSQSRPEVVWVGTGEAQPRYAGYAYPGTGVFKSIDAGDTWQPMGLAETHHVGKVLIHPSNPDIVYVAAMGRQWSANRERGVFRTTDGGAHWEQVLYVDDSTGVIDLAMDPAEPRTLYAWAWQIEAGTRGGLFKSTDGGTTWRRIQEGLPGGLLGRAGIDVAPGRPEVLYLFLDDRAPSTVKDRPYVGGGVYRSDDRGEHWRKVNTEDLYEVFGTFGWKFTDVRVDPRDADHLYILGNRGFESFDGGATWRRFGDRILRLHDTDGRALHLDHHELVIDPSNPDRLLLGNDGGLFMSHDGGASWLHLNDIPVTQMYFVSTDDKRPYRIFAGTQDDAALYGPSNASLDDAVPDPWRSVYLDRWTGGDSYVTLLDPTDDRIVYYEHQNGAMMRMDITGASVLSGGPSSVNIRPRLPRGSAPLRFSWYTPFFISPHDPRTLYAGGNRVLRTIDRGTTWTAVSGELGDPPGADRSVAPTGALTMLTESPRVAGMLAGGTETGRLWLTTDGGTNWRRIDAGLPRKWVSRVILSAHNTARLYASFTGFREDDTRAYVFASNDTGRTWRSIAANLPMHSVNVIKEDPLDDQLLYVGTDLGVYVSRDRGGRWESLNGTLPSTPVQDLTIQSRDNELVIGTHGRGAWILDLVPVRDRAAVTMSAPLRLYPIRTVTLDYFPWETVPGDRRGRNVARMQIASVVSGAAAVSVSDSTGKVVRRWQSAVTKGVNTLTWDLQAEGASSELADAAAGSYTVDIRVGDSRATGRVGDSRATGRVRVLPDPILQRR
ncbi:MAG: hypothetical protein K8S21_11340 [Gemmatimonadetes bacterium]|nr:hypothetical protein [Gemmatimonadota bacterium]